MELRILIINDLRIEGGTEVQTLREYKYFKKKSHDVSLLTFDPKYELDMTGVDGMYNIPIKFNKAQKIYHRLFTSDIISDYIKKVISLVNPEVVHINNVFQTPIDVFKCISNIPTLQTLRDYGVVCPKGTCIDNEFKTCDGYKYGKCSKCVGLNLGIIVKYILLKNINSYRVKYVDRFISPSKALATWCSDNGIRTFCVNNPFDFTIIQKNKVHYSPRTYLYYGKIAPEKGVVKLMEAFELFHKEHPEVKLIFAGKIEKSFRDTFADFCSKEYVEYKGVLTNQQIMELYKSIYCVVVPSLWIENYPNTVLEAIANKTLVIGSNRGGIPELIGDERLLFNILDRNDILKKLLFSINVSEDIYREIVENRYKYIERNNSLETYYQNIMNIYNEMLLEKYK